MGHFGGLGQSRSARGKHLHALITCFDAFTHRLCGTVRRKFCHSHIKTRKTLHIAKSAEGFEAYGDIFCSRIILIAHFMIHNQQLGIRYIYAMCESRSRQLKIQQGGNDTNLGEAKPKRHIFCAVAHKYRDCIAGLTALCYGPSCDFVGVAFHIIIGELCFVLDES